MSRSSSFSNLPYIRKSITRRIKKSLSCLLFLPLEGVSSLSLSSLCGRPGRRLVDARPPTARPPPRTSGTSKPSYMTTPTDPRPPPSSAVSSTEPAPRPPPFVLSAPLPRIPTAAAPSSSTSPPSTSSAAPSRIAAPSAPSFAASASPSTNATSPWIRASSPSSRPPLAATGPRSRRSSSPAAALARRDIRRHTSGELKVLIDGQPPPPHSPVVS
ncbi:hypothetical protein MUK42_07332 [Musa troglodytarum]|uniref:Uncharacterized protein n=2 Tax=Musa troglodytarum TaxID=320322 RepID=A0A9E7EW88_9LILI|nr:hypothetical protein MUK42_07332 [Musa troglodytarum]